MAALERISACGFSIDDAQSLDSLDALSQERRLSLLLPTETLFSELGTIRLPAFYEKLFRSGCEIYFKKLGKEPPNEGARLRVCSENGEFFALGEVKNYPDGTAIKSLKLFKL
jgi:tRNA U55 pseudouridine synthase TruB